MRPDFERIISNEKAIECFREFARSQHTLESLDCLVDIGQYKKQLLALHNNAPPELSRRDSNWSSNSSGSNNTTTGSSASKTSSIVSKAKGMLDKLTIGRGHKSHSNTPSMAGGSPVTLTQADPFVTSPMQHQPLSPNTFIASPTTPPVQGDTNNQSGTSQQVAPSAEASSDNFEEQVSFSVALEYLSNAETLFKPSEYDVRSDISSGMPSFRKTVEDIFSRGSLDSSRSTPEEIKHEKQYEKLHEFFMQMIETYFTEGSGKEINIDGFSRKQILDHSDISPSKFIHDLDYTSKYYMFDRVELQLLLLLKGDVLPRFSQSDMWQNFVLENGDIANDCCYPEDLEKMKSLRYTKFDFEREQVTQKELDFCDMVAGDISSLKHMLGSNDLSVFFSKGDQFVDQQDVGVGAFNMSKAVGFLPFPAEVVLAAECSPFAIKKFLPTTIFDQNDKGEELPFLDLPEKKSVEKGSGVYPSWVTKFTVNFGPIFDKRTSYAAGSLFYVNGRYIIVNKAIFNPAKYKASFTRYSEKKDELQETKAVNSLVISIHVMTPISKDKCHFVHLAVLNVGGLLNPLAGKLYKQTVGKVSSQQQITTIKELTEMKQQRYLPIEDGYQRAKEFLTLTLKANGKDFRKDCPFPRTFEQFQRYA